ncbi:transposase [Actinoallomurus iriomotensis]|uniref:Transposase IS116/IS110/IS902 C-terminal domain-containing protein n=1 Tax=Actinoallomurus iriomotensis TaxID=478107 RepID=A0A9W6SBK1_9ACTN|nr:transposase [Actinoallomurus iriomotensis]GLY91916.1 hypothetical protein Airi02_098440 [Actinoallomurus iriomotensis]
MQAAETQTTTLPGGQMAAVLVAQLARDVMVLNEQVEHTETLIEDRFNRHEPAEVITSMPGIGVLLGAEFLAATGGDMDRFASADHLAGYAGLAPVPRDSGKISGNRHRPRPLQPRPQPGVLHIRADQRPLQQRIPHLL